MIVSNSSFMKDDKPISAATKSFWKCVEHCELLMNSRKSVNNVRRYIDAASHLPTANSKICAD